MCYIGDEGFQAEAFVQLNLQFVRRLWLMVS